MTFQEFLQDIGPEVDVRSYSGRGIHGRRCLGVVCTLQVLLAAVFEYGKIGEEFDVGRVASDSMGRDTIFYWPDTSFVEDVEDAEFDGRG